MNKYIYQNWSRGYRKLQTEEKTLFYFGSMLKNIEGRPEVVKAAKKFIKKCTTTEAWARYAYEHDLPFTVCKMDAHHVDTYLIKQYRIDSLSPAFLDEYGRVFMYYVFNRQPNGRYFCIGMIFWEFEEDKTGDGDHTKSWIYTFETNGNVQVIERVTGAKEECVWTSKRPLNVESNWEEAPVFGEWDSICRMKRWKDGELDELYKGGENPASPKSDDPDNKWLPPWWNKED
jgi:hypothetical protein